MASSFRNRTEHDERRKPLLEGNQRTLRDKSGFPADTGTKSEPADHAYAGMYRLEQPPFARFLQLRDIANRHSQRRIAILVLVGAGSVVDNRTSNRFLVSLEASTCTLGLSESRCAMYHAMIFSKFSLENSPRRLPKKACPSALGKRNAAIPQEMTTFSVQF